MMKVEDIELHTGAATFPFTPMRRVEVKCEASNALMPAPTIDEANGRLRALAAKIGANAIVDVTYDSGISFTSWKSLKASGLAGTKLSDEVQCEVCAETIKRAATKCRFCGAERSPEMIEAVPVAASDDASGTAPRAAMHNTEVLRDNNNPMLIVGLIAVAFFVFMLIAGSS